MMPLTEWDLPDIAAILFLIAIVFTEFKPFKLLSKTRSLFEPGLTSSKLTVKDIPGPRPLPVIGTRWIFFRRYQLEKLHEAHKGPVIPSSVLSPAMSTLLEHISGLSSDDGIADPESCMVYKGNGDLLHRFGPIVKEEALWNFPVINVFDRSDIEQILRQQSKYPIRPPTEVTAYYRASRPDRYSSLGLINEQGEAWHTLRSHLTPEITSAKTMSMFFPELLSITEDFIRLLKSTKDPKGNISNFDELASHLGLESASGLMLGKRLGILDEKASEVALRLADAVKEQFLASRDTYYGLPFWKLYPTAAYKQFVNAEEEIYDLISEMVENAELEEKDTYEEGSPSVFLSILRNPGLDIREKKAAIIDFIAAGIKTLGNTLVFVLYLMAKNKQCQEKISEEINSLTFGNELTLQALGKAQYLKACITETYRMLPTAPCVARILEQDMEIQGYHLSAGSVVLCHTWQACMREENFPNADQFLPERWLNGEKMPFLVAPYGAGRRLCPGKRFVELELQVLLAEIVRRFKVDFDGELDLQFEFLLAPKTPTNIRLTERI